MGFASKEITSSDRILYRNKYVEAYFKHYVRVFRMYSQVEYSLSISGLGCFVKAEGSNIKDLLCAFEQQGFHVRFVDNEESIECLRISYTNLETRETNQLSCNIDNLLYLIWQSSKTKISVLGIIIINIVSNLICQVKILYKAIVLDLDDTLWKGTLAEEGSQVIKSNLCSEEGKPYIAFMHFIKTLAEELGIYVAICSKNSQEVVEDAINSYDERVFPLKGQIDCIVANYSDKSLNIRKIADQLSILPNSIVFVDDNFIVREEVRKNLPEVFVPEWNNHDELITFLIACCVFDRFELSMKSRNRRKQFKILKQERIRNTLPKLYIKVKNDENHKEAVKLYAKSNQFKFSSAQCEFVEGARSVYFELLRDNGESLGICSALTYTIGKQVVQIENWAISCRYFEIGLEEFILLQILNFSQGYPIVFRFHNTGKNQKVVDLLQKYKELFVEIDKEDERRFNLSVSMQDEIRKNTKLEEINE